MSRSPVDEVLVLGGGAIGLATALALLEGGRGVRVIEAGTVGGATSHGNCGTITPSHAPPLAAPGVPLRALKWMFTPDAPLYLKPRWDPALWRWLAHFAARCNRR
ncbi:MAG: FAD-dependent oxidoreductase, partial [Pseudoxanthomonas sp.]|nr:FAD-dependent oxidoreductase [Pseudoxanthomonas sp.]